MSVKVAGKISSLKQVISGIPQGSGLGLVLFLIFVNSIANSTQCQWNAFANDFELYLSFPRSTCILILQGIVLLQSDLDRVCSLARSWNLRLNISKCVVMIFGTCNNLSCNYSIDVKVLDFVTSHRDLGVLVESYTFMIIYVML